MRRRQDKETQTDASFHFTLGMDSHPSRGRLARRCTEFISGRAKRIPSTRRLLFLVAPGVDAISSADCWVCILVRLCWAPLHTTCADLTHFTTLHYSSLLFTLAPLRLEVGLLKSAAVHLVPKAIHFVGIQSRPWTYC